MQLCCRFACSIISCAEPKGHASLDRQSRNLSVPAKHHDLAQRARKAWAGSSGFACSRSQECLAQVPSSWKECSWRRSAASRSFNVCSRSGKGHNFSASKHVGQRSLAKPHLLDSFFVETAVVVSGAFLAPASRTSVFVTIADSPGWVRIVFPIR